MRDRKRRRKTERGEERQKEGEKDRKRGRGKERGGERQKEGRKEIEGTVS